MGSGFSSDTSVKVVASRVPQAATQQTEVIASSPKKPENAAMDLRDGMKVIENGVNKLEKELSCPVW